MVRPDDHNPILFIFLYTLFFCVFISLLLSPSRATCDHLHHQMNEWDFFFVLIFVYTIFCVGVLFSSHVLLMHHLILVSSDCFQLTDSVDVIDSCY